MSFNFIQMSPFRLEDFLKKYGYPAYVTSVGWLGYSDEKIQQLCKEALNDGWRRYVFQNWNDEPQVIAVSGNHLEKVFQKPNTWKNLS